MSAVQPPTREQIAEAERLVLNQPHHRGCDSLLDDGFGHSNRCDCWKSFVLAVLALFPQPTRRVDPDDEFVPPYEGPYSPQPTPSADPLHDYEEGRFGDDGICHARFKYGPKTRCLLPRAAHAPAEPVSIADMAPGTTFSARWRGHVAPDQFVVLNDGVRCIAPGRWYGGVATELRYASDRIDPSTIRDVTPPPVTPETDR